MITVHVVFNAHLDPIWLWPWPVGLDSALATCRSACDRLDAHPDVVFTRGEAWVYEMIRRTDPALFERIRAHHQAGRWELAGGWWVQPDCNLPSGWGLAQQIALGRRWFDEHFGAAPDIGYNVDSFGHAASLPRILWEGGQRRYIMMRPQGHEMRLPARLFRWRGQADGPEVTVFRLARYNTHHLPTVEDVRQAASELPAGVSDTMFFAGLGDHGGGPTEEIIAWIRAHQDTIPGCRLEFSSPSRFFDAVAAHDAKLPEVVGELQHHAVGCYSVERGVKTAVRRAEQRLAQAAAVVGESASLDAAWRTVCFHQFHDTLGGTCLPSAYPSIYDQLGGAAAAAEEALVLQLRRTAAALPPAAQQRLVLQNASDLPFEGLVCAEAWMERQAWQPHWRLVDPHGQTVPWQLIDPEASLPGGLMASLVFPVTLQPREVTHLRIDTAPGQAASVDTTLSTASAAVQSGELGWS
ncbi:MAG: alpha-mannosidase [Fimbriimonadaceae bacterium]|nr:alpha-mannosidase [Fimbriimonadaceae bacterium]